MIEFVESLGADDPIEIKRQTATEAKKQLLYIRGIYYSLCESADIYCTEVEKYPENWVFCYMSKNHSKTAIKRKITMLRQELLNLERMVEKC